MLHAYVAGYSPGGLPIREKSAIAGADLEASKCDMRQVGISYKYLSSRSQKKTSSSELCTVVYKNG